MVMQAINFDDMDVDELVEFFKDKQFYMYDCNDPSWNRAMVKIREKYGEVRPNPQTGFGVCHGLYPQRNETEKETEGS